MAYTKQTWANGSGGGTPLSAARLQYLEDGLEDAAADADTANAGLATETSARAAADTALDTRLDALDSAQSANAVLAGPTTGSAAAPGYRALVAADVPALDTAKLTSGVLAPARVTAGPFTDGHVVTVQSDGSLACEAPSGGSGGSGGYDPLAPIGSPHALTDEFTADTLDAKWTQVNGAVAGYSLDLTTVADALLITQPANAFVLSSLMQAIGIGATDAFTAVLGITPPVALNNGFNGLSFILANGATSGAGSQYLFGVAASSNTALRTYNLTFTNYSASGAGTLNLMTTAHVIYLKITRSTGSSSVRFYVSLDNRSWTQVAAITPAFTPTHIGICTYNSGGAFAFQSVVHFFRFTTTADAQL